VIVPLEQPHKSDADPCDKHIDFVERARAGGEGNHPLSIIDKLMKLYQHPMLLPQFDGLDSINIDDACTKAPKLEKVLDIISTIRMKGEKVLIFNRSLDMQQILTIIISKKFNIHVDIINGSTRRKGATRSSNDTRKQIIQRFQNSVGFNVLVLSPDVAGIGLTLIEANHVIHYGRWWNPAKEAQATDRVYRIGQTKDVHVYYPIARESNGAFKSFDEKLDALIKRRRELAADFLAPMPDEGELGKELWEDIIGDRKETRTAKPLSEEEVRLLPWDRFEALIALIEEKSDRKSILTPRTRDDGGDVISISGNQVLLIQCKHTNWDAPLDNDIISEMINAFDNYRYRWLSGIANRVHLKLVLVTNGKLTKTTVSQAKNSDIKIVSGSDLCKLLKKFPCNLAEVEMMEGRRKTSTRLSVISPVEPLLSRIKV